MALQFGATRTPRSSPSTSAAPIRAAAIAMGGDGMTRRPAPGNLQFVALQPLAPIDDFAQRARAAALDPRDPARERIEVTPEAHGASLVGLELAGLGAGCGTYPDRPFVSLLQSNALKRALQPYSPWRALGRFLMQSRASWRRHRPGLRDRRVDRYGVAPAVLAYLFHRIEGRFDGRPTLIIIDEGWLALDDRDFAGQLREWLKTLRKKNAS